MRTCAVPSLWEGKCGGSGLALSWVCWEYFDDSGIHLNFGHSMCPRIYAFSWLCVPFLQEFVSQHEDYFSENLFQKLFSTTGALPGALLILLECSRSLFEESVLANNSKPIKTNNKYLPPMKYTSHFQKGVILHVVLVGKSSCAGLETLHMPYFIGLTSSQLFH